MAIRWTEELAVGVEEIDRQHRELFDTAARLVEEVGRDGVTGKVARTVAFLEEYVTGHFALEEFHMKRRHYPAYPAHKAEHTAFIAEFYDLRDRLDEDGTTADLVNRMAEWLGGWLVEHIGRQDKALGAFLRQAGDAGPES
ncbi:MAG: hemerythrin family protein [Deltaproteobacteria bacterium]